MNKKQMMDQEKKSKLDEEMFLCQRNYETCRQSPRWRIYDKLFEIALFLMLCCAVAYSYKCIWDLKCELEVLKQKVWMEMSWENDAVGGKLPDSPSDYESEHLDIMKMLQMLHNGEESNENEEDDDNDDDSDVYGGKRKREIRLSNENTSGQVLTSKEEKGSSGYSGSDEYSLELTLNRLKNGSTTTQKPRRSHRKSKKYYRPSISAEKFYTELESTTSTPVHVRRSRTKQTDSAEKKHRHSYERKPLLQVYGSKETITREEALRRPMSANNFIPERIGQIGNRARYANRSSEEVNSSRELAESVPYNMIMVHYAGDTSRYSRERDMHYFGNGRMQMRSSVYVDWKPAHWTQNTDISSYFQLNQGKVTVSVTGIYLIYAQVQYSNVQEVNGYSVVCNRQVIVQCITTSVHPDKDEVKTNTCDTSTTILLHANDKISLQDLHHGRHVVLTPEKSYFGLILLSPFKEKKSS